MRIECMRHATKHVQCLGFRRGYGTWPFGNGLRAATCHVHAPLLSVGSGIRTWVYVSLAPNFLRRRVPQSIDTLRAQSPPNTGFTLQYGLGKTTSFPPQRTIPDEVDGTYMYHVGLGLLVVNALGRPGPRVGSGNHASAGDHAIIIGA